MSRFEAVFSECHRNNLCFDCDNAKCIHCGEIEADCPKYYCDNDHDCDGCAFIKQFQKAERKRYADMRGDKDGSLH